MSGKKERPHKKLPRTVVTNDLSLFCLFVVSNVVSDKRQGSQCLVNLSSIYPCVASSWSTSHVHEYSIRILSTQTSSFVTLTRNSLKWWKTKHTCQTFKMTISMQWSWIINHCTRCQAALPVASCACVCFGFSHSLSGGCGAYIKTFRVDLVGGI